MNNIVSLSGGKDSTAMLLMMLERNEPIHSVVFFDTGWEFPEMIEHIDKLEKYTGIEVVKLKSRFPFHFWMYDRVIFSKGGAPYRTGRGWPHSGLRWCTGQKMETLEKYFNSQKKKHPIQNCIGIANDEKNRMVTCDKKKRFTRYPLIEYGIDEKTALQYCYKHGFDWGGLYELFGRVSCFCCPLQRVGELKNLWLRRPELWEKLKYMDSMANNKFKAGCTVQNLEDRFFEEDRQMEFWPELERA